MGREDEGSGGRWCGVEGLPLYIYIYCRRRVRAPTLIMQMFFSSFDSLIISWVAIGEFDVNTYILAQVSIMTFMDTENKKFTSRNKLWQHFLISHILIVYLDYASCHIYFEMGKKSIFSVADQFRIVSLLDDGMFSLEILKHIGRDHRTIKAFVHGRKLNWKRRKHPI